jgi:hypothetical protein
VNVEPTRTKDAAKVHKTDAVTLEDLDYKIELRFEFVDVSAKYESRGVRGCGSRKGKHLLPFHHRRRAQAFSFEWKVTNDSIDGELTAPMSYAKPIVDKEINQVGESFHPSLGRLVPLARKESRVLKEH